MKVRILLRKLKFLARLLSTTNNTQSARTFHTLAVENVYGISLVQQCLWLEHTLNTPPIVHQCLTNPDSAISLVNENRNNILRQDWANTVKLAKPHTSLKHVVSNEDIWSRVWDTALDRGCSGTKLSQCLFKTLCWPLFGDRKCHYPSPPKPNFFSASVLLSSRF